MDDNFTSRFKQHIFTIREDAGFNEAALELFRYQLEHVAVYRDFVSALGINAEDVDHYNSIPCMPVETFRNHIVTDGAPLPGLKFTSSGTTGQVTSQHLVRDENLYKKSALQSFSNFYGDPSEYVILALLPSYLERSGSSLVYMMDDLIRLSKNTDSGFYLKHAGALPQLLRKLHDNGEKIFLLGVTYALLDLAASGRIDLQGAIIVETGGMKGTRKEMIREEVHHELINSFNISEVHSEYGMTELLSQAWSKGAGHFNCPPWMKIVIRDTHDPFSPATSGIIHVIDLANVHSCAFLATQDLGRMDGNGFTMLGRTDSSELRGCNLMLG